MRFLGDRRLALLLTQLALLILLVNELLQLATANRQMAAAIDQQVAADATFKRIDAQLDSLARGTQRLAHGGDADATAIVDQLARQGVHINGSTPHR